VNFAHQPLGRRRVAVEVLVEDSILRPHFADREEVKAAAAGADEHGTKQFETLQRRWESPGW
jgi:hypothetical protein